MGSQQAELGKRLAGKMGWPTQKTAAGTSLAGHDFRQRKSGKTGRTGCPDARSFPISIRRGQKSPICEPSRGGRKDGGNLPRAFPQFRKIDIKLPSYNSSHIDVFCPRSPDFREEGVSGRARAGMAAGRRGAGMAAADEDSTGASGKRTRPRSPRLHAGRRRRRS